jgi:hypothetical protein
LAVHFHLLELAAEVVVGTQAVVINNQLLAVLVAALHQMEVLALQAHQVKVTLVVQVLPHLITTAAVAAEQLAQVAQLVQKLEQAAQLQAHILLG